MMLSNVVDIQKADPSTLMKLNLARLEKIRPSGTRIIARCPACASTASETYAGLAAAP
jgi:hypothetical protein